MGDKSKALAAGFRGRCPVCHEGALFDGYLKYADKCESCGQNFAIEDAGDGPAAFVILAASASAIPLALLFQMALNPPIWLTLLIWIPIITLESLALLRPFRGMMFAAQIMNQAEQSRWETLDDTEKKD